MKTDLFEEKDKDVRIKIELLFFVQNKTPKKPTAAKNIPFFWRTRTKGQYLKDLFLLKKAPFPLGRKNSLRL